MNYQKNISRLEKEISDIFDNIFEYCKKCKYIDCRGYLWLLPCETERLYHAGLPIIEVDGKVDFLDTFKRKSDGSLDTDHIGPKCIYRNNIGQCTIHKISPFICKLYPLDIKLIRRNQYLVLHHDCEFVRFIIGSGQLERKYVEIFKIFNNLDIKTLSYILNMHRSVAEITKDPKNYSHDDYEIIIKFEKGEDKMSKCVAVLDSKKVKELKLKLKKKTTKKK